MATDEKRITRVKIDDEVYAIGSSSGGGGGGGGGGGESSGGWARLRLSSTAWAPSSARGGYYQIIEYNTPGAVLGGDLSTISQDDVASIDIVINSITDIDKYSALWSKVYDAETRDKGIFVYSTEIISENLAIIVKW